MSHNANTLSWRVLGARNSQRECDVPNAIALST